MPSGRESRRCSSRLKAKSTSSFAGYFEALCIALALVHGGIAVFPRIDLGIYLYKIHRLLKPNASDHMFQRRSMLSDRFP